MFPEAIDLLSHAVQLSVVLCTAMYTRDAR